MKRSWFRRRSALMALVLLTGAFALMNVLAWKQAHAMTHFTRASERTAPPEKLSALAKIGVLFNGVNLPRPQNGKTPTDVGLNAEAVQLKGAFEIPLEGWLTHQPDSKGAIVLFHGYGASKDSLLPVAVQFRNLGYDTLLMDFYGSGGSGGDSTSIGYYEAEDVAAAFTYARKLEPDKPVILYGASMGAVAILRAIAVKNIKPDALILECPFDRMLTTVQNRFAAMKLPSFPLAQLLVFWGGEQQGFNGFRHNPMEYALKVSCPTLLMHGESDPRVHIDEVKNIYQNLGNPKTLKLFPGVGHECYAVARPGEWHTTVTEFLKTILPQK